MHYFRDSAGNEIDLMYKKDSQPLPIEIKAAKTTHPSMFSGIRCWQKNNPFHSQRMLIYGGNSTKPINEHTSIISWRDIGDL